MWAVLWSRSRPEPPFLDEAGAVKKGAAPVQLYSSSSDPIFKENK